MRPCSLLSTPHMISPRGDRPRVRADTSEAPLGSIQNPDCVQFPAIGLTTLKVLRFLFLLSFLNSRTAEQQRSERIQNKRSQVKSQVHHMLGSPPATPNSGDTPSTSRHSPNECMKHNEVELFTSELEILPISPHPSLFESPQPPMAASVRHR